MATTLVNNLAGALASKSGSALYCVETAKSIAPFVASYHIKDGVHIQFADDYSANVIAECICVINNNLRPDELHWDRSTASLRVWWD